MENEKVMYSAEDLEAMVKAYLDIKSKKEELEAQLEELKKTLTEAAASAEDKKLILGEHKVTLVEQSRFTINYKMFSETHPRLAKKFAVETRYNVLRVR